MGLPSDKWRELALWELGVEPVLSGVMTSLAGTLRVHIDDLMQCQACEELARKLADEE